MALPEVRIISIETTKWKDKILAYITYYSQSDSPHMCMMSSFVTPKVHAKLRTGMTFTTYQEFEDFLNAKT